ncbi:penicillin acylase family protein [Planctomicrobium sp. SH661]|uniref:penicillin acylase family protein n=1 Tax=Planctomicrobium sp. SH661 TaxID=3448124 RepID=UPI003F5B3144
MRSPSIKDILVRLGRGDSIASVCSVTGLSREEFNQLWKEECRRRVPAFDGNLSCEALTAQVHIERDAWGIPHVRAANDLDLFFGFGYVTAQDRLFQLDYTRRKAQGRLSEIRGAECLESDRLYRTLDLTGIAQRELTGLPEETLHLLEAYSAGVNAQIEQSRDLLPIEFDLLDYQPEPWSPLDCLTIEGEFRWYLTGRFPVIVIPELIKRVLGDGEPYRAFLSGEEDAESIVPAGSYPSSGTVPVSMGGTASGREDGPGSNNWVLAGNRTSTGMPLVASDPHVLFGAVSIWQEVVLQGGSFEISGAALAGMPAVMLGRNRHLAWGFTNNICSLRDLYQERTDAAHAGCFLYDGVWEPEQRREEIIRVRDGEPSHLTVRSSRNGPIVDEFLPVAAKGSGPVSLRWRGTEPCGWLTALLGMNRSKSCQEFCEATRPWTAPTFNLVVADVDGRIALQTTGRIPLRKIAERGYRPGWDPEHQWIGSVPFEGLPRLTDPERGFVVTANNRLVPDDYPYPLSGTWSSGYRAKRIREQLEAHPVMTGELCQQLQLDVLSGRALADVPRLVNLLAEETDPAVRAAVQILQEWNGEVRADSVAANLFNVFFRHWCYEVTAERIPEEIAEFVSANANGLATRLLEEDSLGWFHRRERSDVVRLAFHKTLDELTRRFGSEMSEWTWGKAHTILQKHFLSGRGDLGELLDRSGAPTSGDGTTVFNASPGPTYEAYMGATYRMVADLADPACGLWAVEMASSSGHPGSSHYDDQFPLWSEGKLRQLSIDISADEAITRLELNPARGLQKC